MWGRLGGRGGTCFAATLARWRSRRVPPHSTAAAATFSGCCRTLINLWGALSGGSPSPHPTTYCSCAPEAGCVPCSILFASLTERNDACLPCAVTHARDMSAGCAAVCVAAPPLGTLDCQCVERLHRPRAWRVAPLASVEKRGAANPCMVLKSVLITACERKKFWADREPR